MDVKRFEKMLALSGADLARWPDDAARDARLLMIQSAEARKLHQAMQWVDQALATTRPKAEPQDVNRVINGALAAIRDREQPDPRECERHREQSRRGIGERRRSRRIAQRRFPNGG